MNKKEKISKEIKDLENPNVKKKIKVKDWLKSNSIAKSIYKSRLSNQALISLLATGGFISGAIGAGIHSISSSSPKDSKNISIPTGSTGYSEPISPEDNRTLIECGEILRGTATESPDKISILIDSASNDSVGKLNSEDVDKYLAYKVNTNLNIRSSASTNSDKIATANPGDSLYINISNTPYNLYDSHNWQKALYIKDGQVFDCFIALENNYATPLPEQNRFIVKAKKDTYLEHDTISSKELFSHRNILKSSTANQININEPKIIKGYTDVEITDNDIKNLLNFTYSWENSALYNYVSGTTNDYTNPYVHQCITQDKNYYICYMDGLGYSGDNSTRNYGFGVNISQNNSNGVREKNSNHVAVLEEKYNYDLNSEDLLEPGVSLMPVSIIDEATSSYLKEQINSIKKYLQYYDITFSKSEIMALAAISYQCGPNSIPHLIKNYNSFGNSDELYNNYSPAENNPFIYGESATVVYKGQNIDRPNAYWKAFHDGEFIMASGNEQVITFDNSPYQLQADIGDFER